MKLTVLFWMLMLLHVSASSYSQNVSLNVKNTPIEKVLEEITDQSGYHFVYDAQLIRKVTPVTLSVKNIPLPQVLKQCFDDQQFNFIFDGKEVIIKAKSVEKDFSQAIIEIKGTVTDEKGQPIPGVSIKIKNAVTGTVSDTKGNYKINVPDKNTILVFNFIGYTPQEILIGNRTVLNVSLKESQTALDQVVVVGYDTQKRRDITGAIGSISSKQMEQNAGGSINTSLQGKIAGLQITTNSGEPGAGASVTLRGVSSVNGSSQPLYIIDGLQIDGSSYSSLADGATFSPLNDINPSDIESIEVLKDGASASIYGSRASNGVIIITTKSGKNLKTPEVRVSLNAGPTELIRKIGVLNGPQFRSAYIEAVYNQLGTITTKPSVIDSLHPYYRQTTDWQELMYQRATQYKADLSLSGGSKDSAINYFISASYRDVQPIILNSYYKQQTGTGRLSYKISKKLTANTNFNFSNYNYSRVRTGTGSQSLVYQNLTVIPVYSPYDPITGAIVPLFEGLRRSPLAISEYAKNDIGRYRFLVKQDLNFEILKGLNFNTNIGFDYSNTKADTYDPPILNNPATGSVVQAMLSTGTENSLIVENTITFKRKFYTNHNFTALLGQSYQTFSSDNVSLTGLGLIDKQITTIGGASSIVNYGERIGKNTLASFFTRVNYDYSGRYLLSLVLRRDGSSRFSPESRYGYFPSVSAGWRFSSESFLKKQDWIYDGKLRASYGVTGNQSIGNYAGQGIISRSGSYLGEVATVANGLPNPSLRWETTKQANIGLDLLLLKGRFGLTADVYQKTTEDLLFDVEIPSETGYGTIPLNFGSMQNKGLEISLNGRILEKTFKWDATLTFAINRNKITQLPNGLDYRPNLITLARVGEPIGVFYGLKALGIYARDADNVYKKDPSTGTVTPYRRGSATGAVYKGGDVIWDDINNDGIINDSDRQIIGNPNPNYLGGVQNNFSYKQFALGIFVNYSIGNKVFNDIKRSLDGSAFDTNFSIDQLRRWRKQGDLTDVPRLVKGDAMQNYAVSSRSVEDGSFIRVQNISLTYNLKPAAGQKMGMKNLSVGITGVNLLTFSKYTGYDPEVSSSSNVLEYGIDNGAFPRTKSINVSLNARF